MPDPAPSELRAMFDAARFRALATLVAECHPGFDTRRFVRLSTTGLAPLSLLQRLRHGTRALHATLPADYSAALAVLHKLAPRLPRDFVGMLLPDYVGVYGHEHFDESMAALRYFTGFSSGEFAIREFLRRDLHRTLAVMVEWSLDPDEHVRRLASEGSRPRLPWSFRLDALVADPRPTTRILENLQADPSLYVRKSVANHLNDITKDHADWVLALLRSWNLAHPATRWIAKRAVRTLIKAGHPGALALFDFTADPRIRLTGLRVSPARLRLGGPVAISFALSSASRRVQTLAVDYRIHYVKASGRSSAKVFKLREVTLAGGQRLALTKRQTLRDFTTRRHYAGRHRVEILVNGRILGQGSFQLET